MAALSYVAALLAFMPARAALQASAAPVVWSDVAGTAWDGEVALRDRVRLGWTADPLRSATAFGLAGDVGVQAAGTDLSGRARLRPGSVLVEGLSGRAGWTLVSALSPGLPLTCDLSLQMNVERLAFGGAAAGLVGTASSAGGSCSPTRGVGIVSARVPALVATAAANDAASTVVLSPRDGRGSPLMQATLTRSGALAVQVTPAGAALVPGAFVGPVSLETQL